VTEKRVDSKSFITEKKNESQTHKKLFKKLIKKKFDINKINNDLYCF
jgi:hypothetical protein